MADNNIPIILADLNEDPQPKRTDGPIVRSMPGDIKPVMSPARVRDWALNPDRATIFAYKALKEYPSDRIEVIYAGEYIGLVHVKPGDDEPDSTIIQYDIPHERSAVVYKSRWAEPQVQRLLRIVDLAERSMPLQLEEEYQQAALASMTIQQANERIGKYMLALDAMPNRADAVITLGKVEVTTNRIYALLQISFGSVHLIGRCDAVRGIVIQKVELPTNFDLEALLKFFATTTVVGPSFKL